MHTHTEETGPGCQGKAPRNGGRLHIRGLSYRVIRVVKCCNRLPMEMVGSPSLEVFKKQVDVALSGGLGSAGLTAELDDLRGLFQPEQFYDFKGN